MDTPEQPKSFDPRVYLPLASGQTRVLELEPGEFSDPIVGRLVPQAIINGPPYEAISYVWGDKFKRRLITINGVELSVPESLHAALTAFRYRPDPPASSPSLNGTNGGGDRQVRRLWADAVCINQDDLPERISQVEQMAHIYADADRVLAWLGWDHVDAEGREHTRDAILFIQDFMQDPAQAIEDARVLLHHHDHEEDEDQSGDSAVQLPWRLNGEESRRRFEDQTMKWKAVKSFFEIEYFHRTWIVQELGLAREAIIHTAVKPDEMKANKSDDCDGAPLTLNHIAWPLLGRFVKYMDFRGASLVTHLDLASWVAHHTVMVWETKDDGTPVYDFLTGLHWARILRVTDPRDRVYGLLGHPLAVVDGRLIIKPDYSQTRGVIYTRLAVNCIRAAQNLDVVALVDHEEHPSENPRRVWDPQDEGLMPTWVPDWHSINRTTPFDYPVAAAELEDADIRLEGDAEGIPGAPLPHLLARGWLVDEIVAVSHQRMETTDFPIAPHWSREQAKKNPFWLGRLWEDVLYPTGNSDTSGDTQSTKVDALVLLETLSTALAFGTKEMWTGDCDHKLTLEEHQKSFAAYILEYHQLWRSTLDAENGNGSPLPIRHSLFDSLPPAVQAEIRRRAEGANSSGFVDAITWPSMSRVVYRTRTGLVGLGSRLTRPGDLVCRVRGSMPLMTVRRIADCANQTSGLTSSEETYMESITCAHIGPTVVPARVVKGIVDGEHFGEKAVSLRMV